MRIGQNNGVLTRIEEINYLTNWFNEFSEMQKDDFLEIICDKYGANKINKPLYQNGFTNGNQNDEQSNMNGGNLLNGVHNDVDDDDNNNEDNVEIREQRRPPSIFECRMKLFNDWFPNWSDEEKQDFLNRLRNLDNEFMNLFDGRSNRSTVNGNHSNDMDQTEDIEKEETVNDNRQYNQDENNLIDEEKEINKQANDDDDDDEEKEDDHLQQLSD